MTVQELIEKLMEMPMDALVIVHTEAGGADIYSPVVEPPELQGCYQYPLDRIYWGRYVHGLWEENEAIPPGYIQKQAVVI